MAHMSTKSSNWIDEFRDDLRLGPWGPWHFSFPPRRCGKRVTSSSHPIHSMTVRFTLNHIEKTWKNSETVQFASWHIFHEDEHESSRGVINQDWCPQADPFVASYHSCSPSDLWGNWHPQRPTCQVRYSRIEAGLRPNHLRKAENWFSKDHRITSCPYVSNTDHFTPHNMFSKQVWWFAIWSHVDLGADLNMFRIANFRDEWDVMLVWPEQKAMKIPNLALFYMIWGWLPKHRIWCLTNDPQP